MFIYRQLYDHGMSQSHESSLIDGRRTTVSEHTKEPNAPDLARSGGPSKLRYRVILHAPTSMVRGQDETPITYLNKREVYSLSVVDQAPPSILPMGALYRSHVRISFDDEEQRRQPRVCWQIWGEECGLSAVHQCGGLIRAVNFVEGGTADGVFGNALVNLDSTSHDGFVVLWYPRSGNESKGFSMRLRFNFLATDFGPSKGVKGVPVRLCVKTEMQLRDFTGNNELAEGDMSSEICYCKVKLFRDHGAERKLSNDTAHVMKSIEKIEKEITDAESSDIHHRPAKRKRHDRELSPTRSPLLYDAVTAANAMVAAQLPARFNRFNQTTSSGKLQDAQSIDELKVKLATLHSMLASMEPTSVLNVRGEELDDPDLYPVHLGRPLNRGSSNDHRRRYQESSEGSTGNQSPASIHSQNSRGSSPPRASSIGTGGGHITPPTIPFQPYQFRDEENDLYRPSIPADEQLGIAPLSVTVDKYHYTSIQPGEVRLMVLYPGSFGDPISCGLKILPLHRLEGSQLVYQALSYAWGPTTYQQLIWIEDVPASGEESNAADSGWTEADVVPRKFLVRANLHAALRRLRSTSEQLWFWIDAICINQDDLIEKSHQLPKMLDIYCNAWSVCIWLGESEGTGSSLGPNEPFDLAGTIVNLKLLDHIIEASTIDEQMMSSLVAFAKLLKRPWFRRRWVIQEVSSSTRASVQCGSSKVNWIDFADAVQLFVLKLDRIRASYRRSSLFERDTEAFSHVEAAGASAIVRATNDVLRKGEDGTILARLCDIETLVMRFVHFEASVPHDTIFALWSLANTRSATHVHVPALDRSLTISELSYMLPCESIYVDFVCHCIQQHGSLDILCRHWALPLDDYLQTDRPPRVRSWIGTTTNSPFGMHLGSGGRMNGDSLVGAPGRRVYNASNNTLPIVQTLSSLAFDTMLRVTGRIISRVSQVSPRVVDGIVPYDALRLLGWTDRATVDTIPDRVWRTLVADRATDGSKAPSWWRRASMFALSMASRDGDLSTQKLLQNKSLPGTVHEYLRRVQDMVWNRRIFALESSTGSRMDAVSSPELAGLGPRDARQGDLACVLMGCSVIVLLREVASVETEELFELIGECYIHGMMDGEALGSTGSSVREFNLV